YPLIRAAAPNAAHSALAALHRLGRLDCCITQNIDGLHQRAGLPAEAVIELHGNATRARCLECGAAYTRDALHVRLEGGEAVPHRPPSEQGRRLELAEAYQLQDKLREALLARGERLAGWKAAFTNRAAQEANQLAEPGCAFLLASGVLASGAEVPFVRFSGCAVEAEVAFVMRRELAGPGVTPARAATAVEGALAALELVDFRYSGKATGTDVIAEGVYAVAIVLGGALTPITGLDLALEGL